MVVSLKLTPGLVTILILNVMVFRLLVPPGDAHPLHPVLAGNLVLAALLVAVAEDKLLLTMIGVAQTVAVSLLLLLVESKSSPILLLNPTAKLLVNQTLALLLSATV